MFSFYSPLNHCPAILFPGDWKKPVLCLMSPQHWDTMLNLNSHKGRKVFSQMSVPKKSTLFTCHFQTGQEANLSSVSLVERSICSYGYNLNNYTNLQCTLAKLSWRTTQKGKRREKQLYRTKQKYFSGSTNAAQARRSSWLLTAASQSPLRKGTLACWNRRSQTDDGCGLPIAPARGYFFD